MSVVNPNVRFTYDDYQSLPDSMDGRYELLDGELRMVPAATTRHQAVARNLLVLLYGYARKIHCGIVLAAPIDVVFGAGDQREVAQPDVVYVSQARRHIVTESEIQGAPDLIVEVLSPGTETRDRGYKQRLYARYGVTEYWIVDPVVETVEKYRAVGASFECAERVGADSPFASDLFPDLRIEIREVFSAP
jgi:Uma2 family endonuclease